MYSRKSQHDNDVLFRELQVGDVLLVEVLSVVQLLEPELSQRLTLRVGPHDSVLGDVAGQPYTVKPILIENSGGVPNSFSDIYPNS